MKSMYSKPYINIVCVGTPRVAFDSISAMAGSMLSLKHPDKRALPTVSLLKGYPIKVYGTLGNPIHSVNIHDVIKEIDTEAFTIVLGTCVSMTDKNSVTEYLEGAFSMGKAIRDHCDNVVTIGDARVVAYIEVTDDDIVEAGNVGTVEMLTNKIHAREVDALARMMLYRLLDTLRSEFRWRRYLKENLFSATAWKTFFCTHFLA